MARTILGRWIGAKIRAAASSGSAACPRDRAVDHAQVVVYFSNGADGRARRMRVRGFLFDGNSRAERAPRSNLHFRAPPFDPGIAARRRKAIRRIGACPSAVDGVKSRAKICPNPEKPCDERFSALRGIFEVDVSSGFVLARAANDNFGQAHVLMAAPTAGPSHPTRKIRPS